MARRCQTCGRLWSKLESAIECRTCHVWRCKHDTARPPRPTRRTPPPGMMTSTQAAEASGLSYRQVDYWARTGRGPDAEIDATGSGSTRWWSPAAVEAMRLVKARLDWGMTLDAACRTEDPPLPMPRVLDTTR